MALREDPTAGRYGSVALDGRHVIRFGECVQEAGDSLINGGVYCMDRRAVQEIGPGRCSIEQDVFPRLAAQGRVEGRIYHGAFLDIGIPEDLARADGFISSVRRRPAAFLDRDGVLNLDHGYVHKIDDLDWVDGAQRAIKALNDAGHYVFVVTNQAGVARGYYDLERVHDFHRHMNAQLRDVGAHIDAFEYCPYHPDGCVPEYAFPSRRRKPQPGMLLDLMARWPVNLERSFLVGDKTSDLDAARAAGVKGFLFPGGNLLDFLEKTGLPSQGIWGR
jgi:D-glycero-D-manno-heptose 1,7-bisphosphate phosphatase